MKTKAKIFTRSLALFLALITAFYAIPSTVFAAFSEKEASSESASENAQEQIASEESERGVYEIKDARTENVKIFKMPDGSYTAAQYTTAVHRLDSEGKWQDIDNSLKDSGSEFSTSDTRVKFAKKITGNETLFTLHEGNEKITFALNGAEKKTVGEIQSLKESEPADELSKLTTLENLSSRIIYRNILKGIDLEYVVFGNDVKENIIVKEKSESYSYEFTIKLNNLTAELLASGTIAFLDSEGKISFCIPAPVIYDAGGAYAEEGVGAYSLTDNGNGSYLMTFSVNADWMNAEERAYPVTLDPTVSMPSDVGITDLYISSNAPDTNFDNGNLLASASETSYIKISDLDFLPRNSFITNANLSLYVNDVSSAGYVYAYSVKKPWDSTLTWNGVTSSVGKTSKNASSYKSISASDVGTYVSIDITDCAYAWCEDKYTNYGVALTGVYGASVGFASGNSASTKPTLTISFRNLSGIENYLSYYTHSIGGRITGNVNLATGNLVITAPTLSTTGSVLSYTPTITYNTTLANLFNNASNAQVPYMVSAMGVGFKWNIRQSVIRKTYNVGNEEIEYYIFSDSDGTEHAFYENENGVFQDENGLQLELTNADNCIYITSADKTTTCFVEIDNGWRMDSISDAVGNKITFDFNGALHSYDCQPSAVYFTPAGEFNSVLMLEIAYSGGSPSYIYNPTTKEGVIFRYSREYNGEISAEHGWYLREIEYCKGSTTSDSANFENAHANGTDEKINSSTKVSISYNSKGYIVGVFDSYSKYGVEYDYSGNKVSNIREYKNGNFEEFTNRIDFTYQRNFCNFLDHDGSIDSEPFTLDDTNINYNFDKYGRVVSAYSTEDDKMLLDYAQSVVYETNENAKNNVSECYEVDYSSPNYITNGRFEGDNDAKFDVWKNSANVTKNQNPKMLSTFEAKFNLVPESTDYIYQYLRLTLMTNYTVSFDYSKYKADNSKLYVTLESISEEDYPFYLCEEVDLKDDEGMATLDFTLTGYWIENTIDFKFTISVECDSETEEGGYISIDNVRLLGGYNKTGKELVNIGGFDKSCIKSSGSVNKFAADYWTLSYSSFEWIDLKDLYFEKVGIVRGAANSERYLSQRIYEGNCASDCTFIVSGYGWAPAAVACEDARFALRLDVTYDQGSGEPDVVVSKYFDFLSCYNGWQYVSGAFSADINDNSGIDYSLIKFVDIVCEYSYQANAYAYFDNISVVMQTNEPYAKYSYNEDGTLKSYESDSYSEYYEYDGDKNLIRLADNKGNLYDYTYDENGFVETERYFKFTYNSTKEYPYWKNNIDASITKSIKSFTEYTYNEYGLCTEKRKTVFDSAGNSETTLTSWTYSTSLKNFGNLTSEKSSLDTEVLYFYDDNSGKLVAVIDEISNTGTMISYDDFGKVESVIPATYDTETENLVGAENEESVVYEYNEDERLSSITTDSTTYNLNYDSFGNTSSILADENSLASYEYDENDEKLLKITYGNGLVEEFVYNDLDMITEIWYTKDGIKTLAYSYFYNPNHQLSRIENSLTGKSTEYYYDANGCITSFVEFDTDEPAIDYKESYLYDGDYRLSSIALDVRSIGRLVKYTYVYNADDLLSSVSISDVGTVNYTVDSFYRLTNTLKSFGAFSQSESYTYKTQNGNATGELASYTATVNGSSVTYNFTFDSNSNITKIALSSGEELRYVYDNVGQLVREDNTLSGFTYVYEYDNAGNLSAKKKYALTQAGITPENLISTDSYTYPGAGWGDLLLSFNGASITYDGLGNPLSYYNGYSFTWFGHQLIGASRGNDSLSFEYNDEGIRTAKTKNGVRTDYYFNGNSVIAEVSADNQVVYIYDALGAPVGFQHRNSSYANGVWDTFYFEKNVQGDIVAVYNAVGTKLVSYVYDAWGNTTVSYHNNGETTYAANNPFRYRGYYYDLDLGLYYLNSRYYDSNSGRFINSDEYVSTGQGLLGFNMFAYCGNNPVNYVDFGGNAFTKIQFGIDSSMGIPSRNYGPSGAGGVVGAAIALAAITVYSIAKSAPRRMELPSFKSAINVSFIESITIVAPSVNIMVDDCDSNARYWRAERKKKVIYRYEALSYEEAKEMAAAEKDLICINRAAAYAIVWTYPGHYHHSAHNGGTKCGYLNHYHLKAKKSYQNKSHIWYYGD